MKLSRTFAVLAAAAAMMCAGNASASLTGTNMTMSVTHAGPFAGPSAINNVTYTYGAPSMFTAPGWGNLVVTSPPALALPAGFDNAIKLDFTAFNYQAFAGQFATIGTVKLTNLAEAFDLSSVKILINGIDKTVAVAPIGNGFQASWNTMDVISANPATPNLVVAWDSAVPAPGAMALLGAAGLVVRRRRRR